MKKMKKMSKRGLALLMSLLMCMSMLNLTAFADEGQATDENTTPAVVEAAPTPETTVEAIPTAVPTEAPVADPTAEPITETEPTAEPTAETEPTASPEGDPTAEPTEQPTEEPADDIEDTQSPADKPTEAPVVEEDAAVCICTKSCQYFKEGFLEADGINHNCPVCDGDGWKTSCKGKDLIIGGDPSHAHELGFWGAGTVKANCQMPEAWALECDYPGSGCGAKLIIAFKPGSTPASHQFNSVERVDATCTVDGHAIDVCSVCGEKSIEVIPATGHTFDKDTVEIVEPTCVKDGSKTGTCTVCNETVTEVIPALGKHTEPNTDVKTQEPTCTEDGYKTYTCSVCNETVNETIPAKGHVSDEKFDVVDATCGVEGSKTSHCTTCEEAIVESIPALNHEFGNRDNGSPFACVHGCGTSQYKVFTYEDGATPSGSHYETQYCGTVTIDKDGKSKVTDWDGNLISNDGVSVIINTSLMGKDKATTDESGNVVTTRVVGYRDMDNDNGTIYKIGDVIPCEEIAKMHNGKYSSWAQYYNAIYLKAVRETITTVEAPSNTEYEPIQPVKVPHTLSSSQGITVTCDDEKIPYDEDKSVFVANLTITIDATVPNNAHVNLEEALATIHQLINDNQTTSNDGMQPGDSIIYNIKLVNNSGKQFDYVPASGFIATMEIEAGEGVDFVEGFDGSKIPVVDGTHSHAPRRIFNQPLKVLLNGDLNRYNDEGIGAALKAKGYGTPEMDDAAVAQQYLDDYYLDWLNAARARNGQDPANGFSDLTIAEFAVLTDGPNDKTTTETCSELFKALHYFYYGRIYTYNGMDIYNHMANKGKTELETKLPALLGGATYSLITTVIDGENANNGFQNTKFGFRLEFDLTAVLTPPPVVVIPTPTPTPTATPTPTPEPTEEPTPTPEPDEEIPDEDVPLGTPKPEPTPEPDEEIPDEDVPLGTPKPEPTPEPDEEIPDPDVPLGPSEPEPTPEPEEEIPDEDVPLANTPKTGDNADIWFLLSVISAAGLVFLGAAEWKKRKGSHGA